MKTAQVLNCNFSTWYSTFKDVTIRSQILPIPGEFIKYLHTDGIVLPEDCHGVPVKADTEWDSDDEELEKDWGGGEESATSSVPQFSEFTNSVRGAIATLGGAVFPKLNWSSPKDATWITLNNSLRCESPADVYLLLKSSTFVAHDLDQPFHLCEDSTPRGVPDVAYELVLRRWVTVSPGSEFRCFVKNNTLIGICQRHSSSYYQHIHEEADDIIDDILTFYTQKIRHRFLDNDYVFDVFRKKKGKVQLLDFNPFGHLTDGLLFRWDDLLSDEVPPLDHAMQSSAAETPRPPAFRYVSSEAGIQSSPYRRYGLPQDFVDLSTGMDADKLVDLLQLQKIQDGWEDEDVGNNKRGPCPPNATPTEGHTGQGQGHTQGSSAMVTTKEADSGEKHDMTAQKRSSCDT